MKYNLSTRSLQDIKWTDSITNILLAALQAVDPLQAIKKFIKRSGYHLSIGDLSFNLKQLNRVLLVGAGKASYPMAVSVAQILGSYLTEGTIIIKDGHRINENDLSFCLPQSVEVIEASHPIPDKRGLQGTSQIIDLLKKTQSDDLVICLLSGGGSALMFAPYPEISLPELQELNEQLLACGATINEINILRKHLDQVKGGRLAELAVPANLVSLILSDVIGDPLDVIASGPTAPDPSTNTDALSIIYRYDLINNIPSSISKFLKNRSNNNLQETPKPDNPIFNKVHNVIIGNNLIAAEAAQEQATLEGMNSLILTTYLQGEARQAGPCLAAIAKQIVKSGHPIEIPACVIAGGETIVKLLGDGKGGRNQELALSTVNHLAGLDNVYFITLATDGGDGPTDAAGAIVTGNTLDNARNFGMNPEDYLARNDSYHFFQALGDLLKPGPTLTNVNDLTFIFAMPS